MSRPSPTIRRRSNRSLTLSALMLSLGLHAAAAAVYGGYQLGGAISTPPRLDVFGDAWISISIRGESGAPGGRAAAGAIVDPAAAQSDPGPAPGVPQPQQRPPSPSALPLVAAAAPALESAVTAIGRSLEAVVESATRPLAAEAPLALLTPPEPSVEPSVAEAIEPSSAVPDDAVLTTDAEVAASPIANGGAVVDGDVEAIAAAATAATAGGGGGASGVIAAAYGDGEGLANGGGGDGASAGDHGAGNDGAGDGAGAGEGSGGGASGAGLRGLWDEGRNQPPEYPQAARLAGQEGEVIVLALSDASGAVERVSIERSSGFPLLDEAALEAVKHWSFVPATEDGVAVAGYVLVPIRFVLRR